MIDFIKTTTMDKVQEGLINNPLLNFKGEYSITTGEIEDHKLIAFYKGLKFTLYKSGLTKIEGSIHKYYNFNMKIKAPNQKLKAQIAKGFNGNDFDFKAIEFVLNDLKEKFNLNINNLIIRNIEFGFNLKTNFNPNKLLNGLIKHKAQPFSQTFDKLMYYRESKHSQFIVKCYNKGLQYGLDINTIRVELKYVKMEYLNKLGVVGLGGLKNKTLLQKLKDLLIIRWEEIIMYDHTINKSCLNKHDKSLVQKFKNQSYWLQIEPKRMDRPKKQLKRIVQNYSKNTQEIISKLIELQFNQNIK